MNLFNGSANQSINKVLNSQLVPITKERIEGLAPSQATKNFLFSIGLPNELDEDLKDKLLLTFYHSSPKIRSTSVSGESYVVIGDQEAVSIAINQNTDQVFAVDEEQEVWEVPAKFINSNIQNFIECLALYLSYENELVNADDNEAAQIVNRIKGQFKDIDAASLNNPNNFWSEILEQVEAGLM